MRFKITFSHDRSGLHHHRPDGLDSLICLPPTRQHGCPVDIAGLGRGRSLPVDLERQTVEVHIWKTSCWAKALQHI